MARIVVLFNDDASAGTPGEEARADVLKVAQAMVAALQARGHQVEPMTVPEADFGPLERLGEAAPDLVVNLCESLAGEASAEAVVPAFLEALGLSYTGSGPLALGLALHKPVAKRILQASGVPTPRACLVERLEALEAIDLPFPVIVKPSREDASVGIDFDSVCRDRASLHRAVARVLAEHRQPALVEQYVDGREIYVPLLEHPAGEALPMTEVSFGPAFEGRPRIVGYAAKWLEGTPEYRDTATAPAVLDPALADRIREVARSAFAALGCRDYGRVDLRVTAAGEPYVIEVNPNCDLHPDAGFAKAARAAGLDYPALASCLVETALARTRSPHADPTDHP